MISEQGHTQDMGKGLNKRVLHKSFPLQFCYAAAEVPLCLNIMSCQTQVNWN